MRNDRELLELAAKAAGITLTFSSAGDISPRRADTWDSWNPLTDDGDSFRLGIALKIRHRQYKGRTPETDYIEACYKADIEVREIVGTDPYAATRRAITRAAAEIGRQGKD